MMRFLFLFGVLLLAACGPRYVQDYDLFPPASVQGKQCVTECALQKERCEKTCYEDALRECSYAQRSNVGFGYGYGRRGGYWDTHVGTAFPSSYDCRKPDGCMAACRETQIVCHENCGGTVSPRAPRCVSGCQ